MKTHAVPLLLSWLLLSGGSGVCRAADAGVTLGALGPERAGDETPPTPELHVAGGAPVAFRAVVDAPAGTRVQLRADLFQLAAGGLAAPLQENVPVAAELAFETAVPQTVACTLPALPEVKVPTRFALKLSACAGEPSAVLASAALDVTVYPTEVPDAWKKFFAVGLKAGALDRLAVFGRGRTLRQFLRARRVAFDDLGVDWPAVPAARTLYVGETPPARPARIASTDGWRLVEFLPPAPTGEDLPAVYRSVDARGGVTTKVFLPGLLDGLADDPRHARTLEKIFRLVLDPQTPVTVPGPSPTDSP